MNLHKKYQEARLNVAIKDLHKVEVTAPLSSEIASLAAVAEALSIPDEEDRQPDLQYLTAIFVSSGMNKNGAVFLGSELIKARSSIDNKAVDIEHDEQRVVGQITGSVFMDRKRAPINLDKISLEDGTEDIDNMDMDIAISAIIHKSRFPELAQDIIDGKWMVSMEAYYRDYDIKVGDNIIPREEATVLGYDKLIGSVVHVKDGDKELGFHLVGRVLRDILFAGVAVVQNPANPRSIIMEAAALNEYIRENSGSDSQVINLADVSTLKLTKKNTDDGGAKEQPVTKEFIKQAIDEALDSVLLKHKVVEDKKEEAKLPLVQTPPGTCVNYKRYVYNTLGPEDDSLPEPSTDLTQYPLSHRPGEEDTSVPGAEVSREHYCNLFDLDCTSRPGDATKPDCWRNVFARTVRDEIISFEQILRRRRAEEGLQSLQDLLDEMNKD
jgi:hypothetical protein